MLKDFHQTLVLHLKKPQRTKPHLSPPPLTRRKVESTSPGFNLPNEDLVGQGVTEGPDGIQTE